MTGAILINTRIRAGIWEGLLTGQTATPQLEVMHLETALAGVRITEVAGTPGQWAVHVPIPVQTLNDGVQTFVIIEKNTEETLGSFAIIAGSPLDEDLRGEVNLLRAELDLLKRAFRRHCVETSNG